MNDRSAEASSWLPPAENLDETEVRETLDRLHGLSHLLDDAVRIPGTDYRVGLDPLLGLLPVVGDVFDAVWKANARNVRLAEARRVDPGGGAADRRFLLVATGCLFGFLLALGAASALVVVWLVGRLGFV